MADVLAVLARLPKACADWSEADQCGVLIKRGVMGTCPLPLSDRTDVAAFNESKRVTPEQLRAMRVGCILGWDNDGAMVQTPRDADPIFVYTSPFLLMMSVQAPTEEAAAKLAQAAADNVAENISLAELGDYILTFTRDGDELDLIDEHRHR